MRCFANMIHIFPERIIALVNPIPVVMFFLIILEAVSWLPYSSGVSATYECGEHGRFEYCIDGIPGCVVGCHCHPGYFFDTDTKVCEANDKLIYDYKRHHHDEPTRIQMDSLVEQHVNAITNDTDDIGDWLYNQFFKTIENQVLNKTDKEKSTRRSGASPKVLTRRSSRRKKKFFKRSHKHRRKNLAIPGDDSMFASSASGSSSQSDSDSNSDSSSSDSRSRDYGGKKIFEKKDDNDYDRKKEDHGHSKILIINKKPKPPLPSFIFLPNMDTPFFPPVGIGAAMPAMPMYPMVPVPPLLAVPKEVTTTEADETTSPDDDSTTHTPTTDTPTADSKQKTDSKAAPDAEAKDASRQRVPSRMEYEGEERDDLFEDPKKETPPSIRAQLRKKAMLRRLRNRPFPRINKQNLSNKKQKGPQPLEPPQSPSEGDYETDTDTSSEVSTQRSAAPAENVNFKYLSELIKSKQFPDLQKLVAAQVATEKNFPLIHPLQINGPARRMYNPYENTRRDGDENYFSNLGRQIATLIRHVDTKDDQNPVEQYNQDQIAQERNLQGRSRLIPSPDQMMPIPPRGLTDTRRIAQDQTHYGIPPPPIQPIEMNPPQPVFNENSYAARSYWERSVRSPLATHATEQYDYLKKSNEDLYDLENRVKNVATTMPFLSLPELENMINMMKKYDNIKKTAPFNRLNTMKLSNTNLDIDLLPTTETSIHYTQHFQNSLQQHTLPGTPKLSNYDYRYVNINDNYPHKKFGNENRNIGNSYNDNAFVNRHLTHHKHENPGHVGPYPANPSNNFYNTPRNFTIEQNARRFLDLKSKNGEANLNMHNLSPYERMMLNQNNLNRAAMDRAMLHPDYQMLNRSYEYPNMANYDNNNHIGVHLNHKNRNIVDYQLQGLRSPMLHRHPGSMSSAPNGPPAHHRAPPPQQQTALSSIYQLQKENQVGTSNIGKLLGQKPLKQSYFQHGLFFDDFEN